MIKAETEEIETIIRYIKEKITVVELTINDPNLRLQKLQEYILNPQSGLNRTEGNYIIKKFLSGNNIELINLNGKRRNSHGEVVQGNNVQKNINSMSSSSYDRADRTYDEHEQPYLSPIPSNLTTPRETNKNGERERQRGESHRERGSHSHRDSYRERLLSGREKDRDRENKEKENNREKDREYNRDKDRKNSNTRDNNEDNNKDNNTNNSNNSNNKELRRIGSRRNSYGSTGTALTLSAGHTMSPGGIANNNSLNNTNSGTNSLNNTGTLGNLGAMSLVAPSTPPSKHF